jgi:hypothetical protein
MADYTGRKIEAMHRIFGAFVGKTCKDCPHLVRQDYRGFRGYKCEVYGESHSEATDWRRKWTACGAIEQMAEEGAMPIYKRIQYERNLPKTGESTPQSDGQISIYDLLG